MIKGFLRSIIRYPGRSLAVLIAAVGLLILSWLAVSETEENKSEPPPGEGPVCETEVAQPKCYQGEYPAPVFKWRGCGNAAQKKIRIQVDDLAFFNNAFPSPEFDSGEIDYSGSEYKIDAPVLKFGENYYWGVTIYSDSGKAGGWWGWGDERFTVAPACQN